jgi:membrane protease YdiL (CAAX protease family)
MEGAVVAAGVLGQAAVWWLIALGRIRFWWGTTVTFAILGAATLLVRSPGSIDAATLGVGVGSGVALYAATRLAVTILGRVQPFAASMADVYGRSAELPPAAVWAVTLALAVPGEELFWRGLVLPELQDATSLVAGACLAWLGYVAVNAVSRNLAILAAAIVGGAWWTILGSAGDVGAAIASHLVWTGLMLAWPPTADRAKVTT